MLEDSRNILLSHQRKEWLEYHGKMECIDFVDIERAKLKQFFLGIVRSRRKAPANAVEDNDAEGDDPTDVGNCRIKQDAPVISIRDFEEQLIGLGLCHTHFQVMDLCGATDENQEINFDEFLAILQREFRQPGMRSRKLMRIFKMIMDGRIGDKQLSFPLVVSSYRRKMIMESMMAPDGSKAQQRGAQVLKAFKMQLSRSGML